MTCKLHTRTITAGDIGIGVTSASDEVTRRVDERYEAFMTGEQADLELDVSVRDVGAVEKFLDLPADAVAAGGARDSGAATDEQERRRLSRPGTLERGTRVYIRRNDFAGWIDPGAHCGEVAVREHMVGIGLESFLRISYSFLAPEYDGLVVHSAGMTRAGRGYLFFGPSETGKSTLSRLSLDHATVLSDEMIVVRKQATGYRLYGTPFYGDESIRKGENASAPLCAAFMPVKSPDVRIGPCRPARALAGLLTATLAFGTTPRFHARLMSIAEDFLQTVPCYELHFRKDDSFWALIDDMA